jgi:hypothetical protein
MRVVPRLVCLLAGVVSAASADLAGRPLVQRLRSLSALLDESLHANPPLTSILSSEDASQLEQLRDSLRAT